MGKNVVDIMKNFENVIKLDLVGLLKELKDVKIKDNLMLDSLT